MNSASGSQHGYEAVIQVLGARTGLSFPPSRYDSAEIGIRRAMVRAGTMDLMAYRELLETDPQALDDLIIELTIGETYFFRDPAHFEFIRHVVLPEIARVKGDVRVIRAWSAGCASGEEAFSLAILFEEEGRAGQAHILATDISRAALAKARSATYSAWSLRGDEAATVRPYLSGSNNRYLLDERIRRRVSFEHLNLALDVYPSFATGTWGMDLILCRNVLIYFDLETIRKVAGRLFASLAEGGWLLTGPSDPILTDFAPFQPSATEAGLVYRRVATAVGSSYGLQDARGTTKEGGAQQPTADCLPPTVSYPLATKLPELTADLVVAPASGLPPIASSMAEVCRAIREQSTGDRRVSPADPLEEARHAFVQADYFRVVELTRDRMEHPGACALHAQALANLDINEAEHVCREATARHPLAVEIQYLYSILLLQLERDAEAARALRRVIYLDRSLALAHFSLGSLLRRRGDVTGARRAYRNARDLAAACPADSIVPLSDGEQAGRLVKAAEAQLALIESAQEVIG